MSERGEGGEKRGIEEGAGGESSRGTGGRKSFIRGNMREEGMLGGADERSVCVCMCMCVCVCMCMYVYV